MFFRSRDARSTDSEAMYRQAMGTTDSLLEKIKQSTASNPAIAVISEVWKQRANVSFLTIIYQLIQEECTPHASVNGRDHRKQRFAMARRLNRDS